MFSDALHSAGCQPALPPPPRRHGLLHVSDWVPTTLELAGVAAPDMPTRLDGMSMWQALLSGGDSPRTELLHEIDRVAFPRFGCAGPVIKRDGNGSAGWHLPSVEPRYVRAALHTVINGTHFKLVIGECAGKCRASPYGHRSSPCTALCHPNICAATDSPRVRTSSHLSRLFNLGRIPGILGDIVWGTISDSRPLYPGIPALSILEFYPGPR